MLFSDKELYDCANFKGLSHWFFQSWFCNTSKVCDAYYYKYEV